MRPPRRFAHRRDAGRELGEALRAGERDRDPIVIGLPRGGVIVAAEVAAMLGAPLDVLTVRKLGVPGHEELAMGAIASGGCRHLNADIVRRVRPQDLARVLAREGAELDRRDALYRQGLDAVNRGDLASARTTFEQVIKLAPGSPEGHNSLGWVLFSQGHTEEAALQIRIALRLKPNFPAAHINLANALTRSGKLAEAEAEARAAVRLAPGDSEAHRTLGPAPGNFFLVCGVHRGAVRGRGRGGGIAAFREAIAERPGVWIAADDDG